MKTQIVKILRSIGVYGAAKALDDRLNPLRAAKHRRAMAGLYAQFVRKGDLCFDVGANLGNRTEIFVELGAKVVAVEPQELCMRTLREKFGAHPQVTLVKKGLAEKDGAAEMMISEIHMLSTFSTSWVEKVRESGRFGENQWKKTETVELTTLDHLIREHGEPAFVKIDVEGFELEVVKGLTKPVPSVSLEFASESLDLTIECIQHLAKLGMKQFTYSLAETMKLHAWMPAEELVRTLKAIPDRDLWGDIYVKRS